MSCSNCQHSKTHNATCAEMISSNGHSTWHTALPANGSWEEIVGGDFDNIFEPTANEDNSVQCAQFKWATSVKKHMVTLASGGDEEAIAWWSNNIL